MESVCASDCGSLLSKRGGVEAPVAVVHHRDSIRNLAGRPIPQPRQMGLPGRSWLVWRSEKAQEVDIRVLPEQEKKATPRKQRTMCAPRIAQRARLPLWQNVCSYRSTVHAQAVPSKLGTGSWHSPTTCTVQAPRAHHAYKSPHAYQPLKLGMCSSFGSDQNASPNGVESSTFTRAQHIPIERQRVMHQIPIAYIHIILGVS